MGGYAWVTLATNDSYSLGALVLANSIRRVGTAHQLAVLITPGVTTSMREKLSTAFDVIKEVNILDSQDQSNLRLLQRPELGITFTKLNCWRLTQFDKCVFLDADTLLLQNSDELFEREEFSAAPDVGWPDCFNSGVFVYRPSETTYDNLVKFALQVGSFDGADQGLLNQYFNEWAHKDISKHLPFIYNVCSTAMYSYMPAFKQYSRNIKIIHFIGNTKPWLQHFNFETRQVQMTSGLEHLHGIMQQWWEIFCSSVHPVLVHQMASNSAFIENYTSLNFQPSQSLEYPNLGTATTFTPVENTVNMLDPWDDYTEVESPTVSIPEAEPLTVSISEEETSTFKSECVIEPTVNFNIVEISQINESPSDVNQYSKIDDKEVIHVLNNSNNDFINSQIDSNNFQCKPETPVFVEESLDPCSLPDHSNNSIVIAECNQLAWADTFEPISSVMDEIALQVDPIESSDNNAGLAGAFAQLTLGCARTEQQRLLEDNLRRQNWESGNIDYMGRDAFDNIWSKICTTLTTPETTATQEKEETAAAVVPDTSSKKEITIAPTEEHKSEQTNDPIVDAPSAHVSSNVQPEPLVQDIVNLNVPLVTDTISTESGKDVAEATVETAVVSTDSPSKPENSETVCTKPAVEAAKSTEIPPKVESTEIAKSDIEKPNIPEAIAQLPSEQIIKDEKATDSTPAVLQESSSPAPVSTPAEALQEIPTPASVSTQAASEETPISDLVLTPAASQETLPSAPVSIPPTALEETPLSTSVSTPVASQETSLPAPVSTPTASQETLPPAPVSTPAESPETLLSASVSTPTALQESSPPAPVSTPAALQETPQPAVSSPPSELPLEPKKVEVQSSLPSEEPSQAADTGKPKPDECLLKKSPEQVAIPPQSSSPKPEAILTPPPSLEKTGLEQTKPKQTSEKAATKESTILESQETPAHPPSDQCPLKKSEPTKEETVKLPPVGEAAKIATPQEIKEPKSVKAPSESVKKPSEVEPKKVTPPLQPSKPQPVKEPKLVKPKEVQKPPQADAAAVSQPPKESKLPQKAEPEKDAKKDASSKPQVGEASDAGIQQTPAPPPRKSAGTKKVTGKSKK